MIPRAPAVLCDAREYQRLTTVGQLVLRALYRKGETQAFVADDGGDAVDALLLVARHRGELLARDSRAVLERLLVDEYAPAGLATVRRDGERWARVELCPTSVDRARVARLAELAALDDEARIERKRAQSRASSAKNRAKTKPSAPPGGIGDVRPPGSGDARPPGVGDAQPPVGDRVTGRPLENEEEDEVSSSSSSSSPEKAGETDVPATARPPLPPPPGDARVGDARHSVTHPPGGEGGATAPGLVWSDVAGFLGGGSKRRIGVRGTPREIGERFAAMLTEMGATREHLVEMARLAAAGELLGQDDRETTDVQLLVLSPKLLGSWFNRVDRAVEMNREAAAKAAASRHAQGSLGLPTNAREATSNRVGPPPAPVAPAATMNPRLADKITSMNARLAAPVRAEPPHSPPSAASGNDPPPK